MLDFNEAISEEFLASRQNTLGSASVTGILLISESAFSCQLSSDSGRCSSLKPLFSEIWTSRTLTPKALRYFSKNKNLSNQSIRLVIDKCPKSNNNPASSGRRDSNSFISSTVHASE